MAYLLHAFIGQPDDLKVIEQQFTQAKLVLLNPQIALIPMTEKLFNEMNQDSKNNNIGKYEFLTTTIEQTILEIVKDCMVAYIEADYFGGQGVQSGIVWKAGKRIFEQELGVDTINQILKLYGIVKLDPLDEFDTIGLGRHRNTEKWIN